VTPSRHIVSRSNTRGQLCRLGRDLAYNDFQVVFTLPEKLSSLMLGNRHALDELLFRCAAESESCHVQLTEYWTYPFFSSGGQLPDTIHNTCAGGRSARLCVSPRCARVSRPARRADRKSPVVGQVDRGLGRPAVEKSARSGDLRRALEDPRVASFCIPPNARHELMDDDCTIYVTHRCIHSTRNGKPR